MTTRISLLFLSSLKCDRHHRHIPNAHNVDAKRWTWFRQTHHHPMLTPIELHTSGFASRTHILHIISFTPHTHRYFMFQTNTYSTAYFISDINTFLLAPPIQRSTKIFTQNRYYSLKQSLSFFLLFLCTKDHKSRSHLEFIHGIDVFYLLLLPFQLDTSL
jgi:hypothetical protein